MNNEQMIHISMINSYNVLIGGVSMEDVVKAGLGLFCHSLDEKEAMVSVEFMISYFKNLEMYEKCSELKNYISETFNEDGTYKDVLCDCSFPDIVGYNLPVKCGICNLTIKR